MKYLGFLFGVIGRCLLAGATLAASLTIGSNAFSQSNPFIGQIMLSGFPHGCPKGWLPADGQLLNIHENQSLFSLLGTTYGGNGRTNFALPDLRGRSIISQGEAKGIPPAKLGERVGNTTVTMEPQHVPKHTHRAWGSTAKGNSVSPTNNMLASETIYAVEYSNSKLGNLNANVMPHDGKPGKPIANVRSPGLVLRYCVAISGAFPPRPGN